jgi:hypothetical protein
MTEFIGVGTPLTDNGFRDILQSAGLEAAEIWSVLSVETSGCGYLRDRRPKILFERHVFSRLTDHRFDEDDPDISQRTAGGYGPSGANQFDRLNAAIQCDRSAALQSASWGLGQIMGENFRPAGFADVEGMVQAMVTCEDNQLRAMVAFLDKQKMIGTLKAHDWPGFARRYNGPNFAANNYDGLLEHFFDRYADGDNPDPTIRAVQIYLTYRGFNPGAIDGFAGDATRRAIVAFQQSTGVAQTGKITDPLLEQLSAAA